MEFFCILKVTEDFGTDPHPVRIRTKMSRIRNTGENLLEK